jgi:hypothetical protein
MKDANHMDDQMTDLEIVREAGKALNVPVIEWWRKYNKKERKAIKKIVETGKYILYSLSGDLIEIISINGINSDIIFPSSICKLKNLKRMIISSSRFSSLLICVKNLQKLEELDFQRGKMRYPPLFLNEMPNLTRIYLGDQKFCTLHGLTFDSVLKILPSLPEEYLCLHEDVFDDVIELHSRQDSGEIITPTISPMDEVLTYYKDSCLKLSQRLINGEDLATWEINRILFESPPETIQYLKKNLSETHEHFPLFKKLFRE